MGFNLVASILVVFLGSPLEIYIFSNMGYLLSLALALIGYSYRRFHGKPEAVAALSRNIDGSGRDRSHERP